MFFRKVKLKRFPQDLRAYMWQVESGSHIAWTSPYVLAMFLSHLEYCKSGLIVFWWLCTWKTVTIVVRSVRTQWVHMFLKNCRFCSREATIRCCLCTWENVEMSQTEWDFHRLWSFGWIYMWLGHLKQSCTQVWYTLLTVKAGTEYVCRNPESNLGPLDLQSNALPSELFRPNELIFSTTIDLFLGHIFNVLVSKLTKEVNSALPHSYWNV